MLLKDRESRSPVIGPAGKASGRQGKGKAKQRSTGGSELPGTGRSIPRHGDPRAVSRSPTARAEGTR